MTHIASSLNAVPIEQRQNPAGHTAKATTHSNSGLTCREEYALPNVTEFCSVVNEGQGRASEGAPYPPLRMGHPQFTTRQILKLYALCACLGFAAMTLAHAKRTADLNANWEMINE